MFYYNKNQLSLSILLLISYQSIYADLISNINSTDSLCKGGIETELNINKEIKNLFLKWSYNINESIFNIDFKYNRTNKNEFIVLTLLSSNDKEISFDLKDNQRLTNYIFWYQNDNTTKFTFQNEKNYLQLSHEIILSNFECQSLGLYILENDLIISKHIYSTQIGLCNNLFPNKNCIQKQNNQIKNIKRPNFLRPQQFFIPQFEKLIFNDYIPIFKRKREINYYYNNLSIDINFLKPILMKTIAKSNIMNYYSRLDKLMLLRELKTSSNNYLKIESSKYLSQYNKSETNFLMRIIKASNLTLNGLDICITNFVKHILMKSDDMNISNSDVQVKYDSAQLINFKINKTNNYIDLKVNIKSENFEFSPLLFLDTLQTIAIKPNKTRNIFIYGDIWIDLDPDMQFTYDYDNNEFFYEKNIYKYQPLWVIALIVIAGVLTVIFVGCIVAICYKRRPYRRASKIYEMEAVMREKIPKIPTMSMQVKAAELALLRSNANYNLNKVLK